ncbi:hypothetical protein BJ508DRAFT_74346 [Ascobolus immersus RN42]|uniref:Uncharacterized protein n=1 Tax=Ascobolus immersus RN42 TaxID=1160509 RepID=A0A3N4IGA0_ASCIM|nr:hypothetical protein BJ508DRAFT_74346 [Ascobolus immersus RN42]
MHVVANFGRDEQVPFLFDPRHPDHLSVIRNAIPIVKEADETEVDKIIGQAKANSRLLLTWYDQPADSRAEHISKREAGADEAENAKVSHVYARTYNRQPPGAEVTGVQQKGKGRSHTEPGGLRPRPFVSESNGGRKSTHGQQLAVLHRGSETQAMAPVAQAPPPSPPSPPFRPHHDYSHGHKYRDRVDKGASYTHHNLQNLPIIHESTSHDPIDGPIVSKPPGSAQPMQLVRSNTMHRPVSRMAPLPSSTTNPNNSHPGAELGNSALSLGQHLPRSFSGEAENRQESLYSETIETRTATDSETDTTPHGEDQEQDQNHNGVTHGRQEDSAPRQPQVSIGTRSVSTDSEFQLDSGLSNIYNNLSGSKLAASSGVHDLRELEISYTSGVQHAANRGSGTEDPTDSTTNKLHEETSLLPGPENGKLRIQRTATDMLMREDRNIDVSGFTPLIGADGVNSPDYPLAEASGNARDGHASRKALAEGPGASHSKEVSGVGGEMQSSSSVSGSVVSNSGGEDSEYSVEQPGGVSSYRRPYAETVIGSPKLSTAQIAPAEDKGKENDGDLIDLSEG